MKPTTFGMNWNISEERSKSKKSDDVAKASSDFFVRHTLGKICSLGSMNTISVIYTNVDLTDGEWNERLLSQSR